MSNTDYLQLSEHKLFQNVRDTLPAGLNEAKSVLAIRDDMLYTWDFQYNCVLALNVKAVRTRDGDNIQHQTLLPMSAPYFVPDKIMVNNTNNLLVVSGPNGVLVFELPERSPPYGCFSNNKEVIYCRTHSLHERALAFSTKIEVRQVRFHPGSSTDSHVAFLTNDNILRVYNIQNSSATCTGIYGVGVQPGANMPSSKISMIESLGETAVDFDFGPPELEEESDLSLNQSVNSLTLIKPETVLHDNTTLKTEDGSRSTLFKNNDNKSQTLKWPIYFLYGDGEIYTMTLNLRDKNHPGLRGPHFASPKMDAISFCSILCIPSTPPVLVIANDMGKVFHVLVLPREEGSNLDETFINADIPYLRKQDKTLVLLERIELELGLNTTSISMDHSCRIYLHRDYSKLGIYFATHETGVHSVSLAFVDILHKYLNTDNDDEVLQEIIEEVTNVEYMVCTKTTTIEDINPVIGFDVFYENRSIVVLLGNGQLVSLALLTMPLPPQDYLDIENMENMTSPLKKMLSEPFDAHIQRILRQGSTQPILKLSNASEKTQQESYELLQRANQVFRDEHFKHYERARDEIGKRVRALKMLKDFHIKEIEKMTHVKQELQEKAENLAERYEDYKDRQEELTNRCKRLLIMISKMKTTPSNAEKQYHQQLKDCEKKAQKFADAISKLKNKVSYQEMQMENWHKHNDKKLGLGSEQSAIIKANLHESTNKIADMMNQINEFKEQLNVV